MEETKRSLYEHSRRPHTSRNPNRVHETEQTNGTFNRRVAVGITRVLSAMTTFWIVGCFITAWILAQYTPLAFDRLPFPLLLTILNIPQISMMIGLGVGQGVLGRKQELQSEEQFKATINSYHDVEQVMEHLSAQDIELLKQTAELLRITPMLHEVLNNVKALAAAQPKPRPPR